MGGGGAIYVIQMYCTSTVIYSVAKVSDRMLLKKLVLCNLQKKYRYKSIHVRPVHEYLYKLQPV